MDINLCTEKEVSNININDINYESNNDVNSDFIRVEIQLTNGCNYQCSYCYGQDRLSDTQFTPIEKLKFIVDQIFKIKKEHYYINILGGEVTYVPQLFELLEYIDSFKKNITVSILTNGSKNIEYFRNFFTSFKMHIVVNISVHLEYAKIDHIKELILLFNEYNFHNSSIILMAHPELKDKFLYFFNNLLEFRKEKYFNLLITEIVEAPDFCNVDSRYTNEYFDSIDKCRNEWNDVSSNNSLPNNLEIKYNYPISYINTKYGNMHFDFGLLSRVGLKKFNNFYCCAGIELIYIDCNGYYKGTACPLAAHLNIYDGIDLLELSKPILCPLNSCGCRADEITPKFRDKLSADEYVDKYIERNSVYIIKKMADNNLNKIMYQNNNTTNIYNDINDINNKLSKLINTLAWWIPIKKWRDNFRDKFTRPDQTRPNQTRPDQTRPDQTRPDQK